MTPLLLFLLCCATVFLGCVELAFSMLMRLSLRLMAERSGRKDTLAAYLDDPLQLFVPVRFLIGFCVVLAAVLVAGAPVLAIAPRVGILLVSLVGFVVLGEHVVPRLIVRRKPEWVLDLLLPVFHPIARVLRPVTDALIGTLNSRREYENSEGEGLEHQMGKSPATASLEKEGSISEEEGRELLQSIVDFTETVVREVMTPRPDVVAISETTSLEELRSVFREEHYSRVPVYRDDLDNIVGIAFVKDVGALPPAAEPPLGALIRPAHFVPESKRAADLLKELQRKKIQLAIVVDEYGGTAGIITVEDLLEEIVGEIRDEYDDESETVTDEGHGRFVFSGKVSVDEVHHRLGVEIEREGFATVGGYLLSHLGRMPYLGETFKADGLGVEVLEVERRRITKVRVWRLQARSTNQS
jgi:putative hemolysin